MFDCHIVRHTSSMFIIQCWNSWARVATGFWLWVKNCFYLHESTTFFKVLLLGNVVRLSQPWEYYNVWIVFLDRERKFTHLSRQSRKSTVLWPLLKLHSDLDRWWHRCRCYFYVHDWCVQWLWTDARVNAIDRTIWLVIFGYVASLSLCVYNLMQYHSYSQRVSECHSTLSRLKLMVRKSDPTSRQRALRSLHWGSLRSYRPHIHVLIWSVI